MGAGCWGTNLEGRVGTFSSTLWPLGKGERLEVQWTMISSTSPMQWSSIKTTEKGGSESFWVGERTEIRGEWCAWRGHKGSTPFPHTLPSYLFCLAVPELYAFIINQWSSKQNVSLSSMSCSNQINRTQGGGHGNLLFIASRSEAQVITWVCNWHLKCGGEGQSFRTEPLACGIWH